MLAETEQLARDSKVDNSKLNAVSRFVTGASTVGTRSFSSCIGMMPMAIAKNLRLYDGYHMYDAGAEHRMRRGTLLPHNTNNRTRATTEREPQASTSIKHRQ